MSNEREENGEQLGHGLPPLHLLYRIFWRVTFLDTVDGVNNTRPQVDFWCALELASFYHLLTCLTFNLIVPCFLQP